MEHVALLLSHMKASTLAQMYSDASEIAFTSETAPLANAVLDQLIALVGEDDAYIMIDQAIEAS